jgi:hypothetical protein
MHSKIQNIGWLIMLLISFTAHAQYRSVFGKTASSWNTLNTAQVDVVRSDSFYYTHDSTWNGKVYKVILQKSRSDLRFLLREDTATGKVWGINKSDSTEVELMDMTLHVGDKFYFTPDFGLKVTSISSRNDRVYIRFEDDASMHGDTLYFIEGIGPTKGLFYKLQNDSRQYLLCAHQDGAIAYLNNSRMPWGGKCSYMETGVFDGLQPASTINVYPNPSAGSMTFSFENQANEKFYLYIYDGLGRKTGTIETSENRIILEKGNKTAGIYYYELVRDGAIVQSGKMKFL